MMVKKTDTDNLFKRILQNAIEHVSVIIIMAIIGFGYNWFSGIIDSPAQIQEMKDKMKKDSLSLMYRYKLDSISIKNELDDIKNKLKNK